jgi:FAD/FMN-containing dehydrogenase
MSMMQGAKSMCSSALQGVIQMTKPKLREDNLNRFGASESEALQGDFAGQLIVPGNADYDTARKVWNAHIDKYPALIARCSGAADVVRIVKFARANNLPVSIRSGGHNVAGRAVCNDGVVIDLSLMHGVVVDPQQRTVCVQAGALLGDVDRETSAYGLAVPAGVYPGTGIAGLTLGGGVGWLMRKYGLTCDNMISAEVVTADGTLLSASETVNPDLFWGLRGAGGDLGIVTSFQFRAHPVSMVLGGFIVYPRDQARAVLRNYRDFMKSAPDELTAYAGLMSTPEGQPAVALLACYCGEVAEGERVLQSLRAFGSPTADAIEPLPFSMMQHMTDQSAVDGASHYWKSTLMTELSDDAIDALIECGNRAVSPHSIVMIEFYGGAVRRAGHPDTAAYSVRKADYGVAAFAQWTDAATADANIAWAREGAKAIRRHAGKGDDYAMLNLNSDIGDDQDRAMFGENFARLRAVKAKYDPTNVFDPNRNGVPVTKR